MRRGKWGEMERYWQSERGGGREEGEDRETRDGERETGREI